MNSHVWHIRASLTLENLRRAVPGMARLRLCLLLAALLCCGALPAPLFASSPALAQEPPLVTQKIRYHQSEAGEVFLVWGVNGWRQVPEAQRPAGTVVKGKVMYTPMVREQNAFVADVRVPLGTTLDYNFQITKTLNGQSIDAWDTDGGQSKDYHTTAIPNTIAEVYSIKRLTQETSFSPSAIAPAYYGIAMLAVVLICGIAWLRRRFRNPYLDF